MLLRVNVAEIRGKISDSTARIYGLQRIQIDLVLVLERILWQEALINVVLNQALLLSLLEYLCHRLIVENLLESLVFVCEGRPLCSLQELSRSLKEGLWSIRELLHLHVLRCGVYRMVSGLKSALLLL